MRIYELCNSIATEGKNMTLIIQIQVQKGSLYTEFVHSLQKES